MIDLVLIAVAVAWLSPLAVLGFVLWRYARGEPTELDRRLSAVDEDLRRRELMQERAARAQLRMERRVVSELQQPRRG